MTRPEWICTGTRCFRARPPLAAACRANLPRLQREQWIRYRRRLDALPASDAVLTPLDAPWMARLRVHPEREEPQVRSAFRFHEAGFGDGFLWLEGGEPLCMIWLIRQPHERAAAALGSWAGMYPPLPSGVGLAEGLYTFRRGLRRAGGAATAIAFALFRHARACGLEELRTHIHTSNSGAQRWAGRVGWEPAGMIHRCFVDLPHFRQHPVYLHEVGTTPAVPRPPVNTPPVHKPS